MFISTVEPWAAKATKSEDHSDSLLETICWASSQQSQWSYDTHSVWLQYCQCWIRCNKLFLLRWKEVQQSTVSSYDIIIEPCPIALHLSQHSATATKQYLWKEFRMEHTDKVRNNCDEHAFILTLLATVITSLNGISGHNEEKIFSGSGK